VIYVTTLDDYKPGDPPIAGSLRERVDGFAFVVSQVQLGI